MDSGGVFFGMASAAECGDIYDTMRAENLLEMVIYDGTLSREEFIALTGQGIALSIRKGGRRGALLGAAWLLDLHAATGSVHFCFFKAGRGEAAPLGRECLRFIFSACALQSLYGVSPKSNRAAVHFVEAVGGRILGEVAGACLLHHRGGRLVPAMVSTFNRKEYV